MDRTILDIDKAGKIPVLSGVEVRIVGLCEFFLTQYIFKSDALSVVEVNEAKSVGYSFHAPKHSDALREAKVSK